MAAATFFPGDRQALDGHGQNHHREQGDRQAALQAELVTEQADHGDQHHDERQYHREARQHLQFQVFQVRTQRQAQRRDQREQDDAEADLRLAERQGNQYWGEGAESLQAAEVAQDQDHQHADRDHDHDLVGLLGLQGQAIQRVLEEVGVGVLVGQLGQADGVHFAVIEREGHLRIASAFQIDQRLVTGPPDQAVIRQALLAGAGVEEQPLVAVEAA